MYCEKCGKQNDDGAIFCSNCSSVLRSRRQNSQPAEGETKRFKLPEEVAAEVKVDKEPVKPVVNEMPAVPVAVKEKAEKSNIAIVEEEEPVKRAPRKKVEPKKTVRREEVDFDEPSEKTGSAWFGVLAAVSWIMFVAFAAVGLIGGGVLVMMGLGGSNMLYTYLGILVAVVFVIAGLGILSNNMIKIKIAKTLNEIKIGK